MKNIVQKIASLKHCTVKKNRHRPLLLWPKKIKQWWGCSTFLPPLSTPPPPPLWSRRCSSRPASGSPGNRYPWSFTRLTSARFNDAKPLSSSSWLSLYHIIKLSLKPDSAAPCVGADKIDPEKQETEKTPCRLCWSSTWSTSACYVWSSSASWTWSTSAPCQQNDQYD